MDLFDDTVNEAEVKVVRAAQKFQPKGFRPKKGKSASIPSTLSNDTKGKVDTLTSTGLDTEQSVQTVDIPNNGPEDLVVTPLETPDIDGNKDLWQKNEDSFQGVRPLDENGSNQLVNILSQHVIVTKDIGSTHSSPEVAASDNNVNLSSGFGKIPGEADSTNSELDPCADVLPQPTASNEILGSKESVKNNDDLCSEIPLSDETRSSGIVNSSQLVPTDGLHSEVSMLGSSLHSSARENADIFSGLDSLDDLVTKPSSGMGCCLGKFQTNPKEQDAQVKAAAGISHPDAAESLCLSDSHLVPETECMDDGSIAAFASGNVFDYSNRGVDDSVPSDPSSEFPMNQELVDHAKTLHSEAVISEVVHSEDVPVIPGKTITKRKKQKGSTLSDLPQNPEISTRSGEENGGEKSSRKLRKRGAAQHIVDEPDDEADDDTGIHAELSSSYDRNDDNNGEDRECSTSKKRATRKSGKSVTENEKQVRKRKKANESTNHSAKEPPKKFSHSTRRNKRQVDRALLEIPEDELDFRNVRIKDLIMIAEYRERLAKKEATSSNTPLINESAGKSSHEDAPFSEMETSDLDEDRGYTDKQPEIEEGDAYFNYHSYMNKQRSARWSKQDTERFYEAVRQLGTDFSMIQQLFPGRTRHQIKLKFKKEEREHPLRLSDSVTTRAKDNSHFELVIERLQAAAQAEQDLNGDDFSDLTGEREVELAPETNAEAFKSKDGKQEESRKSEDGQQDEPGKSEQVNQVADEVLEVDEEVHGLDKSESDNEDEEDVFTRWSQYKSEY